MHYFCFISLPRRYMFRGHFSLSSGGQVYNLVMVFILLLKWLSVGLDKKEHGWLNVYWCY
jgi:hypothetical protein